MSVCLSVREIVDGFKSLECSSNGKLISKMMVSFCFHKMNILFKCVEKYFLHSVWLKINYPDKLD